MPFKKQIEQSLLPLDTVIDVVATNGDKVVIREMNYGESLKLKKSKGWVYSSFQKGFCSMKEK